MGIDQNLLKKNTPEIREGLAPTYNPLYNLPKAGLITHSFRSKVS